MCVIVRVFASTKSKGWVQWSKVVTAEGCDEKVLDNRLLNGPFEPNPNNPIANFKYSALLVLRGACGFVSKYFFYVTIKVTVL